MMGLRAHNGGPGAEWGCPSCWVSLSEAAHRVAACKTFAPQGDAVFDKRERVEYTSPRWKERHGLTPPGGRQNKKHRVRAINVLLPLGSLRWR
jgi:hypothetical protein